MIKGKILVIVFAVMAVSGIVFTTFEYDNISAHAYLAATKTALPETAGVFPVLTLKAGDFYFSIDGKQSFIFSRNITSYQLADFDKILDLTRAGGSKLIRLQLIEGLGMGMSNSGKLDETWARNWDHVLDRAYDNGLYVMPVFSSWFAWNDGTPDYGYHIWESNPLNKADGGSTQGPGELFKKNSDTQAVWLEWVKSLVSRWQARKNIAAWEIFSEVNLASGVTEQSGVEFVERAAAVIRETDLGHRPITASLADVGEWTTFYSSKAVEFIGIHPWPSSGQLDIAITSAVHQKLTRYTKPVLIGESGLSNTLDTSNSNLTNAPNAPLGIKHAIWAAVVSGAMNGRALYWEDSYVIYFKDFGWPFLKKNANVELSAVNFVKDVDFSGFKPLTIYALDRNTVTGAAIGYEKFVIGWFRDAHCEPPDWKLQLAISKQTVTLTVPGSSANWQVDFYSTSTGTDVLSSATVKRKGNYVSIPLPDFKDDIAFKMYVK